MIRKIDDGLTVLRKLFECLLISYQYDAADGVMCFVFDYPEKGSGADRAFIRVRFDGVSNFRRNPGVFVELQKFNEAYSARATRAATVVQNVDIDMRESTIQITLGFGLSFGGVSFACCKVSADTRSARVTQIGSDAWDYHDVDDGAHVDFYDPFA
jgi:hypothetical protein